MDEYGKAKVLVHNAQHHFEALDKKYRRRLVRVDALRVELAQLESSLPALAEKLAEARNGLKAAKAIYRPLRHERKQADAMDRLSL